MNAKNVYLICLIYFFSMLIPMEAFFHIGSVRMELYRLILIVLAPVVIIDLNKKKLFGVREKWLLLFCFWVAISFFVNHGTSKIESGVINFLEVFIGYGLGLLLLGSRENFEKIIKVFFIVFIVLIPFAVIEANNGVRILHILASELFGNPVLYHLGDSYFRHGLHRASTLFSHPILYSICALMLFPLLFLYYKPVKAFFFGSGLLVAMVTSVTSAGFLMLIIQLGIFVLKKLSEFYENIYKLVGWIICVTYIILVVGSNRGPVLVMIQTLALNPATAYARYQQWQFASDDISNNPLFGIGFYSWSRPFWMSDSVDSYWLNITLNNGYPALVSLLVFFLLSLKAHWSNKDDASNGAHHFVFFCSIFSIIFAALTVDFFDRAQLMVFFMLGIYNSFLNKERVSHRDNND